MRARGMPGSARFTNSPTTLEQNFTNCGVRVISSSSPIGDRIAKIHLDC